MFSPSSFALLAAALIAVFSTQPALAVPAPAPQASDSLAASTSNYWLANIERKGTVWGNNDSSYSVFRNVVTDFQADPTGQQDSTEAINKAISDGGRCGFGCNSSTVHPAIVYFPPGKYLVSKPIQMFYYTQMVGDAVELPQIVMASNFEGMAMFDADPYQDGHNWYINQNNFFRQMRNFKMDLTQGPDIGTAIHWQVAQATSLQNIEFDMIKGSQQQGIFMDNGSGGWCSDLKFKGGKYGAFFGSQQFTSRNLVFEDCTTAIYMNWNWGWVLSNITITGGTVGIDMANSPSNMSTGSVMLSDSKISGTQYGVNTSYSIGGNLPLTGNTLVIDNVDMKDVTTAAVWSAKDQAVVVKPSMIETWAQGSGYTNSAESTSANGSVGEIQKPHKAKVLLDTDGKIYGRSKPQYENVPLANFLSAKANGCAGDGETDDTAAVQAFLEKASAQDGAIAYFDHGAYLVSDTIAVPKNVKMTGEVWSLIVADGKSFSDSENPKAVFQVGKPGDTGAVEISDIIFQTKGAAPGAVMIEWNLNSEEKGASGMWDAHVRIGGSANTLLSEDQCPGWPTTQPTPQCQGVFLMFHSTEKSGNFILENSWFWVADHDLEVNNQTQISIFSARGCLIQSQGAVWLWGSASEHSMIYNYQFDSVKAVFGGFMQTETPYFQPNPLVPAPLAFNKAYRDPDFSICPDGSDNNEVPCKDAWGLRVVNSQGVLIYATGFYSFFNNYSQVCTPLGNCQEYMIRIQNSQVDMYTVTTKAAVKMIMDDRVNSPIIAAKNHNVFGDTIACLCTLPFLQGSLWKLHELVGEDR
ncbi:related to glucan 1,3-beta-glucosidase [Ramularia collo-cygni]|uniref:Related to glucan 1,3-beta-glucosidase n=1 Tax=Ramularia collo-cygni TaxID=112498 RepID=A0A2D3VM41_9PEZI|nr:related to glucan 1,3-beta-glucosidase [Ramularia collo-cygni]CZT23764.1 related to glucan 1,3-beta-glucosidase [Ramularia collo-cygni]